MNHRIKHVSFYYNNNNNKILKKKTQIQGNLDVFWKIFQMKSRTKIKNIKQGYKMSKDVFMGAFDSFNILLTTDITGKHCVQLSKLFFPD